MVSAHRDASKLARMEQAVRVLIQGLGEDLSREGLRDTPKRVAKALLDCTQGYHQDTSSTLGTALFHEPIVHDGGEGIVVVRDIDFASTSEETLLPFHGRCHVAYRPKDGVVLGLSKLARLTKQYAKRLQTQERLGAEVALALQQSLECHGVAVVLQARHLSNSPEPAPRTTVCVSGEFAAEQSAQLEELLTLLGLDELPPACISPLDRLLKSLLLPPGLHAAGRSALARCPPAGALGAAAHDPHGPPAPGTPDLSEKDTDGDSDDLVLDGEGAACCGSSSSGSGGGASCSCEDMEAAAQQLLVEIGEDPRRPGLVGSARRYVAYLMGSTAGYAQQLPGGDQQGQAEGQQGQGQQVDGSDGEEEGRGLNAGCPCCSGAGQQRSQQQLGQQPGQQAGAWPHVSAPGRRRALPRAAGCSAGSGGSGSSSSQGGVAARGCAGAVCGTGALSGVVAVRLPFSSQCEHHMLPFYGDILVAYYPAGGSGASGSGCGVGGGEAEQGAAVEAVPRSGSCGDAPSWEQVEAVVGMFTQRLQVQERITHQVADAVEQLCAACGSGGARGAAGSCAPQAEQCVAAAAAGQQQGQLVAEAVGSAAAARGGACGGVMVVCDAAHMCMVARGVENHSGSTTTFAVRGAFAQRPELRREVLRLFRAQQGAAAS